MGRLGALTVAALLAICGCSRSNVVMDESPGAALDHLNGLWAAGGGQGRFERTGGTAGGVLACARRDLCIHFQGDGHTSFAELDADAGAPDLLAAQAYLVGMAAGPGDPKLGEAALAADGGVATDRKPREVDLGAKCMRVSAAGALVVTTISPRHCAGGVPAK